MNKFTIKTNFVDFKFDKAKIRKAVAGQADYKLHECYSCNKINCETCPHITVTEETK